MNLHLWARPSVLLEKLIWETTVWFAELGLGAFHWLVLFTLLYKPES